MFVIMTIQKEAFQRSTQIAESEENTLYIYGIGFVDETLLIFIVGFLAIAVVIILVLTIISIIANWNIFNKAGEKGWKAIVPFYGSYTLFKVAWKPMWFWVVLGIVVVDLMLYFTGLRIGSHEVILLSWILTLVAALFYIPLSYQLSKSFGHNIGFTLGLIFLYPIFILILAFNKSKYVGPLSKSNEELYMEPPHHHP